MAQPAAAEAVSETVTHGAKAQVREVGSSTLHTSIGDFALRETVEYPNGGRSLFYELTSADNRTSHCEHAPVDGQPSTNLSTSVALIVDDDICVHAEGEPIFDYSLITGKQNEYVAHNRRVYRFLREDLDQAEEYMRDSNSEGDHDDLDEPSESVEPFSPPQAISHEYHGRTIPNDDVPAPSPSRRSIDRANLAEASPLEHAFEEHFANVYGPDSARYLWREYAITDLEGHDRYIDYLVHTTSGLLGVEENGVHYHHPQLIGPDRYRTQLLKQNSCQLAGIKLFRFSTEDCQFAERLEDDIRTYFGPSKERFVDSGIVASRSVQLWEHQEGALEEMARRRAEGTKCFLVVLPTASGKSRIVEEDLRRFAPTCPDFKALIMAPSVAIASDWKRRLHDALPEHEHDVRVCTYGHINRHYREYAADHFSYIVVDEAHHAVAPVLKRTIQYFDPKFLVGLTATDKRPDKQSLEQVFGSYRVGLSLKEAMERGIIARANAFRIETNVDLSRVRVNGREYVNADLEKTLRVTSRNELIVDVLREYFSEGEAGRRQGVVFCVNVRHAREMERLLNEAGLPAKAISGKDSNPQRIMDRFRSGEIRFLCSCQMISEGWDYPELGILVMARPTLSRVLYLQQLGRGLRRTPTKQNVFVIDVVDEYGAMVTPCSLHSIFQNPCYVPFGDILVRDYQPGELIEVDGTTSGSSG